MRSIDDVVNFLQKNQLLLSTAESCTAGLIASMIADVSGSGSVLESGYVVYSPRAKNACLGVSPQTIERFGLTSEEVAREMALGALQNSSANIVLANTGMAEANNHLDGVVCFACALLHHGQPKVISETKRFDGERNEVRAAAARYALLQLPVYFERLRAGNPPSQAKMY